MLDQLFVLINMNQRSIQEKLIITMIYSQALVNHGEHQRAFNLLQLEYAKHPSYGQCLLYLYAKLVIKHKKLEFLYSAISALEECLRINSDSKYDVNCLFYIAKAYEINQEYGVAFSKYRQFLQQSMRATAQDKIGHAQMFIMSHGSKHALHME